VRNERLILKAAGGTWILKRQVHRCQRQIRLNFAPAAAAKFGDSLRHLKALGPNPGGNPDTWCQKRSNDGLLSALRVVLAMII
jgi:hypothetical protein